MQADSESWIKLALDHPLPVEVQNPTLGKPSKKSSSHFSRISPRLGGKQKRLSDRLYGQSHNNLVCNLTRLSCPIITDMNDVLAHPFKVGLDLLKPVNLSANH